MVTFLLVVLIALSAALAFLVWAFWPVIFQDFRAGVAKANKVEAQAVSQFKRAVGEKSAAAPPAPPPTSKA